MTDRDQESVPETDNGQTAQDEAETADKQPEETEQAAVRVGSLKGPTSIGLLKLMKDAEEGNTADAYTFTMETAADALFYLLLFFLLTAVISASRHGKHCYGTCQ